RIDTEPARLFGPGDGIEISINLLAFGLGVHDGDRALLRSPMPSAWKAYLGGQVRARLAAAQSVPPRLPGLRLRPGRALGERVERRLLRARVGGPGLGRPWSGRLIAGRLEAA